MNRSTTAAQSSQPKRRMLQVMTAACAAALAALVSVPSPAFAGTVRGDQWYLDPLNIPQAQQISSGKGVTVAVIDTGVDNTHPDLKGQTITGHCFTSARDLEPTDDPDGHGTEMAGIIAARGGGSNHALGIAPHAKIMPLCISADHVAASALYKSLAQAIRYAADHNAQVVNISVGTTAAATDDLTAALTSAVRYAADHDVVLVSSAGNASRDTRVGAPANIPGVLAVTGTNRTGTWWSGSAQGKEAALAAPATDITVPTSLNAHQGKEAYAVGNGTSASSAIVAGVAALVRAKYPDLDAANVINRLIRTADHHGSPGRNAQYGYGIVDPVKALTAHVPHVDANPLGEPAAAPATSHAPEAASTTDSRNNNSGVAAIIIVAVILLIAAIIAVVLLRRRSRRATDPW